MPANITRVVVAIFAFFIVLWGSYVVLPGPWGSMLIKLDKLSTPTHDATLSVKGRAYVYSRGGEGQTVLLLHGFGGNKEQWNPMIRDLGGQFDVIALDLPGFGASPAPSGERFTIENQARWVTEFLDELGLRSVHVVGSSMGGHIAAQMAATRPELVRSIALLEPYGVRSVRPTEFDRRIAMQAQSPLAPRTAREFDSMVGMVLTDAPFIPRPVYVTLADEAIKRADLYQKIWVDLLPDRGALPARFCPTRTPSLLVWGDSEKVFHTDSMQLLANCRPGVSKLLMSETGHLPMMERPRETALALRSFVSQIRIEGTAAETVGRRP